jgi:SnoaL-like domain
MKISRERLELTQELHALVIDYWHDVDTNWGRNATQYYTPNAEFVGPANSYKGHDKIRAFYKWREDRGARTVVHSVINFQALPEGPDRATCHWVLALYGADGKPPLPTHPPIQIAYMTDRLVRDPSAGWLVEYRKFDAWFEGGTPTTNPNLDGK